MNKITSSIVVTFILLLGLMSNSSVNAHSGATGVVKDRMNAMSEIAKAMKSMALLVKGKQEFEALIFIQGGELIARHSNKAPDLFPLGSIQATSEALPIIWQQWDDFVNLSLQTQTDAEKLVKMAQDGAQLRPLTKQFVKLASDCKACHKDYRKKK